MSDEETLGRGRWTRLVKRGRWEYVTRTRGTLAAAIVAITDEDEIVLVEQHRVPVDRSTIELPAGLVGDEEAGEAASVAAHRELLEETGFEAAQLHEVASGPSSAGITDESISIFVATGLRRVHAGGGDESENIRVHVVPLSEVEAWLRGQVADGKLVDLKVYAGLHFARPR